MIERAHSGTTFNVECSEITNETVLYYNTLSFSGVDLGGHRPGARAPPPPPLQFNDIHIIKLHLETVHGVL